MFSDFMKTKRSPCSTQRRTTPNTMESATSSDVSDRASAMTTMLSRAVSTTTDGACHRRLTPFCTEDVHRRDRRQNLPRGDDDPGVPSSDAFRRRCGKNLRRRNRKTSTRGSVCASSARASASSSCINPPCDGASRPSCATVVHPTPAVSPHSPSNSPSPVPPPP